MILVLHNEYGRPSGEEAVIQDTVQVLRRHHQRLVTCCRTSTEIPQMFLGKVRAFFSGAYSRSSQAAVHLALSEQRPDIVHVHNLFPLISPSVLPECRRAGVPVVMTVHNYRLVCPNGLHMRDGQVCEKCCGGREYWCVLRNCEKRIFKSLGYALRNYVARRFRLFLDNVTMYAALTEFQRQRLISEGFPAERIVVIPNMARVNGDGGPWRQGDYVAYAGRISPEKGMATLVDAAKDNSRIPFKAAGSYERMPEIVRGAPANMEFIGYRDELSPFYANARIIVLPSICFEGFPGVIAEAMLHARPVVCSRIGGLPEIVDDGVTGLLFEPGNAGELAEKIRYLWDRPVLCRKMGQAGREKALHEYSPEKYYERLMAVYEKAIALGPGGPARK